MADIVLIHSALGLTASVLRWADDMREAGHTVVTPDLFGGDTYEDVDQGVERVDSVEMSVHVGRARELMGELGSERVYAGFSFGAAVAQILALTDPDARGVVLMHGALAPSWIPEGSWSADLTGQLHYARHDPWCDPEEIQAFVQMAPDGALEEFSYEGAAHLFAFEESGEHDAYQGALMHDRVLEFLADL